MPDSPAGVNEGGTHWSRLVLIGLIVLLPTTLVAFLVFNTGRGSAPEASGPATAAPVLADGRSAARELIASLDPDLGCVAVDQITIARVDDLVAAGRLDLAQVPAPTGAVSCAGGGLDRTYVVFARSDDARALFDSAATVTATGPVDTGPTPGCRSFATGAATVVVTCDDRPEIVWTARSEGVDPATIVGQLGR